jgi:hypothetical protein
MMLDAVEQGICTGLSLGPAKPCRYINMDFIDNKFALKIT